MSDNIDEANLGNPTNIQSEIPTDKITPAANTETNNPIQNSDDMEVHHHPDIHHKTKKWKEYLLEGFMIFVAVTMGFFAESYHVHLVNKEIEKRNIESFINNIQKDSANITIRINFCQDKIKAIDSLCKIPGEFTDSSFQKQFIHYALKLGTYTLYQPDESAFLQMQSSGTLRLIKHQNITDSILKYQLFNQKLKMQQEIINNDFQSALDNLMQVVDGRALVNPNIPLKLNENNQQIHNYINYKITEGFATEGYILYLNQQLLSIKNLTPFLKKEYDIE